MPQFNPPPLEQRKSPARALLEPIGQAVQTLPMLWQQYRMGRRKQEIEDMELQYKKRELEARYGKLGASGDRVADLPGMTPVPGEQLSPAAQLNAFGTEGYRTLNPTPTTIFNTAGQPLTTVQGKAIGLPTPKPTEEEKADIKQQAKLKAEKPKALGSFKNTIREFDNMIKAAQSIKNDEALPSSTGLAAGRMKLTEGQRRVDANLETLKAKTLLNVLSSMKELSKTGASGFGQLSEIEGENLRNSISSLIRTQGTEDFKKSLDRFIAEMEAKKIDLQDTFATIYGDIGNAPGSSVAPSADSGKFKIISVE